VLNSRLDAGFDERLRLRLPTVPAAAAGGRSRLASVGKRWPQLASAGCERLANAGLGQPQAALVWPWSASLGGGSLKATPRAFLSLAETLIWLVCKMK
jgi:hypothetical protein